MSLISKKTHCPKCDGNMSHKRLGTEGDTIVYSAYLCDNEKCDHAIATMIEFDGTKGHVPEEKERAGALFYNGLLGNTFITSKKKLLRDTNES